MRPQEQGYLLLCCALGQKQADPLSLRELRLLRRRVKAMQKPEQDRPLAIQDLACLGYSEQEAQRILLLLQREEVLQHYLQKLTARGIVPITCVSELYPHRLLDKLGEDAPAVLFALGDVSALQKKAIGLVGSRNLRSENATFAAEVGIAAANAGYALVSGNAPGADKTAQTAALVSGGSVICFIADRLTDRQSEEGIVYLSEEREDAPFSTFRALRRNHFIHALAERVYVAQCSAGSGGTWAGTSYNLNRGYSPVFVFADGSEGQKRLCDLGAVALLHPTDCD